VAEDKERREQAGVPEQIGMRNKPQLAKEPPGEPYCGSSGAGGVGGGRLRLWGHQAPWDKPRSNEQPHVLAFGKAAGC